MAMIHVIYDADGHDLQLDKTKVWMASVDVADHLDGEALVSVSSRLAWLLLDQIRRAEALRSERQES